MKMRGRRAPAIAVLQGSLLLFFLCRPFWAARTRRLPGRRSPAGSHPRQGVLQPQRRLYGAIVDQIDKAFNHPRQAPPPRHTVREGPSGELARRPRRAVRTPSPQTRRYSSAAVRQTPASPRLSTVTCQRPQQSRDLRRPDRDFRVVPSRGGGGAERREHLFIVRWRSWLRLYVKTGENTGPTLRRCRPLSRNGEARELKPPGGAITPRCPSPRSPGEGAEATGESHDLPGLVREWPVQAPSLR